ncbi:MAG: hypothetical protein ABSF98_27025 [Bryobacteraceae bacterium]
MTFRFMTVALALSATVLFPLARATPVVSGVASLNGTATVTNTSIEFFDNTGTANTLSGAATGNTLSYATLNGIADPAVQIKELSGGPFSGTFPGPGFVDYATFDVTNAPSGYSTIDFDLTQINPGVGSAAACFSDTPGNECTPLIDTTDPGDPWVMSCHSGHTCVTSPFTLVQANGGVDIFYTFDGVSYFAPPEPAPPNSSTTAAILSTQGVINTYGGIVEVDNALHSGNGTVTASVAGTFGSTAVPEPTTALLALSGLLIVAGLYRRGNKHRS